ncbi:MAG: hypothetical protein JNL66_23145 [Alphaproteobacteria bacterium]|nr:hypothetical protein [Alphaproteobacteria bacterium]
MTRLFSAFAFALLLFVAAPALAQPVGTFDVQGIDDGGDPYTGTVTVTQTGQTYRVEWQVEDQTFRGVGIFAEGALSVGFTGEGVTGVAIYRLGPNGVWQGTWAFVDQDETHTENWTARTGAAPAQPPAGQAPAPAPSK